MLDSVSCYIYKAKKTA